MKRRRRRKWELLLAYLGGYPVDAEPIMRALGWKVWKSVYCAIQTARTRGIHIWVMTDHTLYGTRYRLWLDPCAWPEVEAAIGDIRLEELPVPREAAKRTKAVGKVRQEGARVAPRPAEWRRLVRLLTEPGIEAVDYLEEEMWRRVQRLYRTPIWSREMLMERMGLDMDTLITHGSRARYYHYNVIRRLITNETSNKHHYLLLDGESASRVLEERGNHAGLAIDGDGMGGVAEGE